jgi:hypothetical protein
MTSAPDIVVMASMVNKAHWLVRSSWVIKLIRACIVLSPWLPGLFCQCGD